MKKAQITGFIILGIIIIALVVVGLYFKAKTSDSGNEFGIKKKIILSRDLDEIKANLQSCIEKNVRDGMFLISVQGGLFNLPGDVLNTDSFSAAYGYDTGEDILPTIDTIKNEFNSFMKKSLPLCISFDSISNVKVSQQIVKAELELYDNSIEAVVDYDFGLSQGADSYTLSGPYTVELPLKLRKMHATAKEIIKAEKDHPDEIDVGMLLDTEFNIDIINIDDEIIYSITDKGNKLNNLDYTFMFANRF